LARLSIIPTHRQRGFSNRTNQEPIAKTGGSKFVIKLDIINRLADQTGIPKLKAEQAVDALFHSMKEALSRGDRIELRGFGVFIVKPRKRGVGRNPRTGEEVAIPSGKTIRFKPGKELQAHDDEGEEVASD
jgi:DNA-binding protein HU-beta